MLRTMLRPACRPAQSPLRARAALDPALAIASLLSLAPGCYAGVPRHDADAEDGSGAGAEASGEESDVPPGDGEAACGPGTVSASRSVLRSLTRAQYRNAVRDLLGPDVATDDNLALLELSTDGEQGGFASTIAGFDEESSRRYLELAESLAAEYVTTTLPDTLDCDWAQPTCAQELLDGLGRLAFRRPLTPAERDDYLSLYTQIRDEYGAELGVQTLVTALLNAPSFVYLEEPVRALPPEGDARVVELDPYGLASRLSFFLWNGIPDEALLDAAEAGALDDVEGIEAQVDRMMEDPRFLRSVESFHEQWLNVEDVESPSMRRELSAFVDHLFTEGDATIATLLGASYSFVDDELAEVYGVTAPETPFSRVELDPTQRSGVLTQLGFLHETGVVYPEVHRGLFVRESLLCDSLGAPPPSAVEDNEDLEVPRVEHETCGACHKLVDPIGHGFDRYDASGAFRTQAADGSDIDGSGEIRAMRPGDLEGTFQGIPELAKLLIDSPRVQRCFAVQWSRYALRRLDGSQDRCVMDDLGALVSESDGDLRQLVLEIATSTWFRSRAIADFDAP